MEYLKEINILRSRVPIGIKHALTLLIKTHGDIEQAEMMFEAEMLNHLITKANVDEVTAYRHLKKSNYDISAALDNIDEERCTTVELIFRRYKNKEEALSRIISVVTHEYGVEYEFRYEYWADFKSYKKLPKELYCLYVIIEWLDYEDYEGYDTALSFDLEIVTDEIEKTLGLTDLAESLRKAAEIKDKYLTKYYNAQMTIDKYIKAVSKRNKDKEFQICMKLFESQRQLLIDKLYDYIKACIDDFL